MSNVSIVRIGPFPIDSDGAHSLRDAIFQHLTKATTDTTATSEAQPSYQFSITNRYFSADVRLSGMDDDKSSNGTHTDTTDTGTNGTTSSNGNITTSFSEDGMILVFDAERSHPKYATSMTSSFDVMESIHDQAVTNSKCGELLRLCVSIGNNRIVHYNGVTQPLSEKEYEDEYSRRILWCLDHGYEYVEVPDLNDTSQGHDVRDKDGFARIIEAISGTVWTSAVMASKQQQTLQQSFAEVRKDISMISTPGSAQPDPDPDVNVNTGGYEPPNPLDFPSVTVDENDVERERKAHAALLADCITETTTTADGTGTGTGTVATDASNSNATTAPSKNERQSEELQQERAMNALEASLNEARRIRELSKSGQLSDEERRKRASDAAMLIMQTMEQMGFNDDDDTDEDEDIDDDNSLVDDNIPVVE